MKEQIDYAITVICKKITTSTTADEALKFTQAMLNLSHVLAVKNQIENPPKE
jgi:hypothetical protein